MSSGFEDYVRGKGAELGRLSYLLAGDVKEGEYLLQDVLAALLPRWERVAAVEDIDAYVRRALVNASRSRWRRVRRRREVLLARVPEQADIGSSTEWLAEALLMLVRRLPRRQQAVIVLRYYEQRTEAEIAVLLACSEGTVKSQASKARTKLKASWLELQAGQGPAEGQTHDAT